MKNPPHLGRNLSHLTASCSLKWNLHPKLLKDSKPRLEKRIVGLTYEEGNYSLCFLTAPLIVLCTYNVFKSPDPRNIGSLRRHELTSVIEEAGMFPLLAPVCLTSTRLASLIRTLGEGSYRVHVPLY